MGWELVSGGDGWSDRDDALAEWADRLGLWSLNTTHTLTLSTLSQANAT
jgi:hypothetical protein